MTVQFFLLTACAIIATDANWKTTAPPSHTKPDPVATDANSTSAPPSHTKHFIGHIPDPVATDANSTSAPPSHTKHFIGHVPDPVATDANSTSAPPSHTKHFIGHVPDPVATDANSTSAPPSHTKHFIGHIPDPIATDANSTSAPPSHTKHFIGHVPDPGSLSKPKIHCNLFGSNAMHITCFSASGRLPIRYQLFLNDSMLPEKIVHKSEPANFTIAMTPGTQVYLICTAISMTGEKSSNNVTLSVHKDDFAVTGEEAETNQKDRETGPEHLIPLQHILTSVTPDVLERNTLLLITCGPIILLLLVIIIIVTYLRVQKEEYIEA